MSQIIRKIIHTIKAPAAIGPYNQAVQIDTTLYMSGQIGLDPETMQFIGSDVESQTEQVLKNMGAILEAAGTSFDKVVKTTVLLADINDFAKVNTIYEKYFEQPYPARAAFAVANLPKLARVEIEGIAVVGDIKDE